MFLYGRGTENRTLIYGLKARYFAVKLYPLILSLLSLSIWNLLLIELTMEQDIGFEPMTFSLATKHSTTELILQSGIPLRSRTANL
jgi:hypothetical protein